MPGLNQTLRPGERGAISMLTLLRRCTAIRPAMLAIMTFTPMSVASWSPGSAVEAMRRRRLVGSERRRRR
ncbi:hypothetical protein BDW66DRAFT_146268 [Aspergillus desertorum]